MRFVLRLLFLLVVLHSSAQTPVPVQRISGTVINDNTLLPIPNVSVINLNQVRGTTTNAQGKFEMEARVNDTLHLTLIGYQSIRVRVTHDWIKNGSTKIQMTEKAIALEEVIVRQYDLTGYLEVDSKLIPDQNNRRYSINGLPEGYEAGDNSPGAFSRVLGAVFNPADVLYNFFGKKPKELRKLKDMKKDDTVRNLLQTKFDRETIAVLLGISKNEIPEILARCNYSEAFIKTANDLQILDAISACYEEYKVLKK